MIESLESRRLLAAAPATVTFEVADDGVMEVTGTRGRDVITVVEHFPGSNIYDVFYADTFQQVTTSVGFRINGNGGNDRLAVEVNAAIVPVTLFGGAGNDVLLGSPGADVLDGGGGRDHLDGRAGDDMLRGGAGNDSLLGGNGTDAIYGGRGSDFLDGGEGNDSIGGGAGRDNVSGGSGPDLFDDTVDAERERLDYAAGDSLGSVSDSA
jgi:Ca2+-binding RTX toxin-like protein